MLARRLSSEGGGHEAVCQQGCWASKGGGLGVPYRFEKGMSVSKDVGLQREVDCEIPHRLGRRTKPLYKGVETSP